MNVLDLIRQAGRQRTLLRFTYDAVTRSVEPYSFRERGGRMLFFGYCLKCGEINAFDPAKMSGVVVTNTPFVPRWPIEL